MNKEVFFQIQNKLLYLDFMLEEYDFMPLFYVCKDEDDVRYIVLCTDFEHESYLISRITLVDLYNMLSGKIDMRSVFLKQAVFWKVNCKGNQYLDDIVEEYKTEDIPVEYLPVDGENYVLYDEEHKEYAKRIACELQCKIGEIKVHSVKELDDKVKFVYDHIEAEYYDMVKEIILKIDVNNQISEINTSNKNIGLLAA